VLIHTLVCETLNSPGSSGATTCTCTSRLATPVLSHAWIIFLCLSNVNTIADHKLLPTVSQSEIWCSFFALLQTLNGLAAWREHRRLVGSNMDCNICLGHDTLKASRNECTPLSLNLDSNSANWFADAEQPAAARAWASPGEGRQ
jgi:hypothetical protein